MLYSYIQCIIGHSTKIMTSFVSSPLKGDKLPDQIYPIKASKLTLCYGTVDVGYSIQGHTSYEKGFLNWISECPSSLYHFTQQSCLFNDFPLKHKNPC